MSRIAHALICRLRTHLKRGGIVAYPTESCYGLGCLPRHRLALQQLIRLKKRPQHKGMIVIADKLHRLQPLLSPLSQQTQHTLQQTWPAHKTFLLPSRHTILPLLRGKSRQQLAVRVPQHAAARQLCRLLKTALVSTSCNRAKQKPCKQARAVQQRFGKQVMMVHGRCGQAKKPSQIIDWASGKQLR